MYFDIKDQSYDGFAPAISGNLNIENQGNGQYKMTFDFNDDKNHRWYGEWSGEMMLFDKSAKSNSAVPAKVRRIFQNALTQKSEARN